MILKTYMNIGNKKLGIVLIVVSVILFFVFLSSAKQLSGAAEIGCQEVCGHIEGIACPHANGIPLHNVLGFGLIIILVLIGLYMFFWKNQVAERKNFGIPKDLDNDEKKVIYAIKEKEGTIFQSELIEKTGFSKVKISRILDRLEGKGLIERRRRGMTNVVILKNG